MNLGYDVFVNDPPPQDNGLLPNGEPKEGSPVASTLVYGSEDAVLTDPGFTADQARALGDWVAGKDRNLTDIFITHGHGDHWFAAGLLAERFGARVVATAGTIAQMHVNVAARPLLWDRVYPGIPPSPVTAVTVPGNRLALEGHDLVIVEVGHADTDDNSVLHVPDLELVVAGDVIYNGAHMYLGEGALYAGRRTMPDAAAFWVLAVLFLMLFFASAAASPLYPAYQAQFRFSAATLTAVFAVYVLVLLVTLLFFGSVSDFLGRLPVIIAALVFSAAGCGLFLAAHGVGALYAARSLQGIATGLASGPIGAALIDLQPPGSQRAPVVTSAFSTLGLALGALITSALVQYAPAPTHLIWWVLLAVFAAGLLTVPAIAEPGTRRPGVLASLRPAVAVPRQARGPFARAVPCLVATWALGGLYLSLGPSLAETATGSPNLLWGGLVIFLICGTGAAAAYVLRTITSRTAMLAGCLLLLAGVAVTFGAIATTTSAAFLAGTTVAGAGFGLAFQGLG